MYKGILHYYQDETISDARQLYYNITYQPTKPFDNTYECVNDLREHDKLV